MLYYVVSTVLAKDLKIRSNYVCQNIQAAVNIFFEALQVSFNFIIPNGDSILMS